MSTCVFCELDESRVFLENELACALWDAFPITDLHVLVIPRRHAEDYFALTKDELLACDDLLRQASAVLRIRDTSIAGLNIIVNAGATAGQKVFHCHFHLVPRRTGDAEELWGGLRRVTSAAQKHRAD